MSAVLAFPASLRRFEKRLAAALHGQLVQADLDEKHRKMEEDPFTSCARLAGAGRRPLRCWGRSSWTPRSSSAWATHISATSGSGATARAGWSGAPNREARPSQRFRAALLTALPPGASGLRFAARRAGAGSLGRPRWTAIATWRGDAVVREAKALVPSAWHWVLPRGPAEAPAQLAFGPYRSPDAHLAYGRDLMVRRLADSRKLEYPGDFGRRSFPRLLAAMGHELASLHAGTSGAAKRIAADLGERPKGWLLAAAKLAAAQVREDYDAWRRRPRGGTGKR